MIFDRWKLLRPVESTLPIEHPVLRSLATRRGITTPDDMRRHFEPSVGDLHDPALIHGMQHACERIERAIRDRESILIYGDYDVDGVTSIVLLRTVLARLGADAGWVVPQRLVDGYGLKIEVIERVLRDRDVKLVITVDCGISSVEPVNRAIERGIDVIITDHHLPPGLLPDAAALLNPKIAGCAYPFQDLAGVGVAFKLCCELLRRAGAQLSLESLLKITAIGTIADVAPLVGENRTIAQLGLAGLSSSSNIGLRTLLRVAGLEGRVPSARDVGFKLGPRINAAGRLASADTAIELFAAKREDEAYELAMQLNRLNSERQSVEARVLEDAEARLAKMKELPRIIVLAAEGWHRGVVGLCAGKLAQKYNRPALVMSINDGQCVGSGRSIGSINLHAALDAHRDLFDHFGGHEFACGFTLSPSNLELLQTRLAQDFEALDSARFEREAQVEALLEVRDVDITFLAALEKFEPFGAANPLPIFMASGVRVGAIRGFSVDCHEVTFEQDGATARGVIWKQKSALRAIVEEGRVIDLLFHVERDTYRGGLPRLEIVDAAKGGTAPVVRG